MENKKINFSLRMNQETNEYVTSEAERLGMSKSSFFHFLVGMYRKEQQENSQIRLSNQEMYQAIKEQMEKEKSL